MLSIFCNFLLATLSCTSLANIIIVFFRRDSRTIQKLLINIVFILIFVLFTLILYSFVFSDFSLKIVANSTSSILPLKYKIGAIWSSQEGSLLLWLFILSTVGFLLIQNKSLEIFLNYISFLYSTQIFLLSLLLLFIVNPFVPNLDEINILGLNPVLQDVALVIHPPILYIGYSFAYGIFVLIFIRVIFSKESLVLLETSYLLSKFCLLFISLGVFIGSWWAYRELGWGGYWFFDPVENISLMPLCCVIAYYHSLMLQFKDIRFTNISNFLGISIFLLILVGTSLSRSGLIISVHSFVNDSSTGYFIISFAFIVTLFSYILLFLYSKNTVGNYEYEFNKKSGIRASNYLWIAGIIAIIISLIVPIISNVFLGKIITIESSFFIKTLIPILLLICFVMGIFSYIIKSSNKGLIMRIMLAFVTSLYIVMHFELGLLNFFGFFISFYIIEEVTTSFINAIKNGMYERKISMIMSHLGIGLLCLSITINKSFEKEFDIISKIGSKINYEEFEFRIKDLRYSKGPNYVRQIIDVEITDRNGNNLMILSPERRLYIIEKLVNSESNIMSFLLFDIYAVISNIEDDTIYLKIYYKPFIYIIWFSTFLVSFGALIAILINKKKLKLQ